jgi:DNA-binding beta-propeller fold protein YncE
VRYVHFCTLAMLTLGTVSVSAQQRLTPEQKEASDGLRALTKVVPLLPMERIALKPTVKLEGISALAADKQGNIYVIHRPTDPNGDPIVVLDAKGKLLRSWGKGMYKGIRIDADGNIWTLDANLSKVYKFTPEGKQLLEIDVWGIPDPNRDFCGITDVAFSPTGNGHVYIGDGYCNARVIEYDAAGKKIAEWGRRGTGPGEFNVVHGVAIGPDGDLTIPLISNEPVNIGEKRLLAQELAEFFHERPQSRLLHGGMSW